MSTPTIRAQQRWAAEVAHVAVSALAEQKTRALSINELCRREALRAIQEGRLRLASLLFIACAGGNVFTAALRSDYRALPKIPARAKERA